MQRNKYAVFMDPVKMQKIRDLGVSNFSGWVNNMADLFIKTSEDVCKNCPTDKKNVCQKKCQELEETADQHARCVGMN
jgi:hypothetical protein